MVGSSVDVFEEDGALFVEVSLPGVGIGDLAVNASGSRLLIWARRRESNRNRRYRVRARRDPAEFTRELMLPPEARLEAALACLKNGVLLIRIPLAEGRNETVRPIPVVE